MGESIGDVNPGLADYIDELMLLREMARGEYEGILLLRNFSVRLWHASKLNFGCTSIYDNTDSIVTVLT